MSGNKEEEANVADDLVSVCCTLVYKSETDTKSCSSFELCQIMCGLVELSPERLAAVVVSCLAN